MLLKLSSILAMVNQNITNPYYLHYLFESLCAFVRISSSDQQLCSDIESYLIPTLKTVLLSLLPSFTSTWIRMLLNFYLIFSRFMVWFLLFSLSSSFRSYIPAIRLLSISLTCCLPFVLKVSGRNVRTKLLSSFYWKYYLIPSLI